MLLNVGWVKYAVTHSIMPKINVEETLSKYLQVKTKKSRVFHSLDLDMLKCEACIFLLINMKHAIQDALI